MPGSGDWLSPSAPYLSAPAVGQPDAWTAEAASTARRGSQRLLGAGEVLPPAPVAEALGVPSDEPVVVRRRLILLDDQPVELADSYYPLAIAGGTGLAAASRIRG